MNKKRPSLDGFIPRQATSELGAHHREPTRRTSRHQKPAAPEPTKRPTLQKTPERDMGISQSLDGIDGDEAKKQPQTRRERRRALKERRKASKKRRIIKRIIIALIIIVIGIAAFVGIRALIAGTNMFQGGLLGFTQRQPLKQDENGRSNFIIFGTAEDSEGGTHEGGDLTDSLMVLSVDQERKNAYMLSIPRDLWVDFNGACMSGYQGKINEVYSCGSDGGKNEEAGAKALQDKIGAITGLDIQYYVHLNFTAVVDAVDAVGGVDVKIESNPKGQGILDRNFDWKCGYRCHYVKYDDGETPHLDGQHALALMRARNAQGGYGLAGGNFDREKNQQKVIKALRKKALSAGTLTNLGKVTGLIDALGNNLRTNIDTKEVQTIMSLASDIESDAIRSLTLVDEDAPLVTTGSVGAASIVQPVAGLFEYSDIKSYVMRNSSRSPVVREAAKVVVLNGSETAGVAQREADDLKSRGYIISATDNAPDGSYEAVEVYKIGDGNSATADALAKRYDVSVRNEKPPIAVADDVSFVIVLGQAPQR